MSGIDLDAIKVRCEAATPGPWFVERCGDFSDPFFIIAAVVRDQYGDNALSCGPDEPLAEFIAHARTDIPALVAEVEMLRHAYDELKSDADAEVGRLRTALDSHREYHRLSAVASIPVDEGTRPLAAGIDGATGSPTAAVEAVAPPSNSRPRGAHPGPPAGDGPAVRAQNGSMP